MSEGLRELNEIGPMSNDDLLVLAVKECYFPDAESAGQGVVRCTDRHRSEGAHPPAAGRNLRASHAIANDQA
jgi:hypothetical protein